MVPVLTQSQESRRAPAAPVSREQGLLTIEPVWRQALGGAVLSLPSVQAQSAVVALDGGNIRAYSTAGTPLWDFSARGRISPYVTRSREGTSYFSRINGMLFAVNRAGRELWQRNIGSPLSARVVIGWDGRLFVPADKIIYCYTASGNLLWSLRLESPFLIPPQLNRSGGIIFALENNEVYQIDPFGNTFFLMATNKPAVLVPLDRLQILALYTDGTMGILEQSQDWYMTARGESHSVVLPRLNSAPLAAAGRGNNIAIILSDGTTVLLSINEGRFLWQADSHIREFTRGGGRPDLVAEVLFDERGIFVLSRNGATGFLSDGRRLWYMLLQNTAAIPAFGNDGLLYSGGRDWILYAYKIEDANLPERGGIFGPPPSGSYSMGFPHSSFRFLFPLNEFELNLRLEQITAGLNTGRVGANEPAWKTLLMMIAESRFHIQRRLTALHLLGQIGSQETIPWLVTFYRQETEPAVRAAAIKTIGRIGVDPHGIAMQSFLFFVGSGAGVHDEQVLAAIVQATGALCRFSGPPLSETGVRILTTLTARTQHPVVRDLAIRELASLR